MEGNSVATERIIDWFTAEGEGVCVCVGVWAMGVTHLHTYTHTHTLTHRQIRQGEYQHAIITGRPFLFHHST